MPYPFHVKITLLIAINVSMARDVTADSQRVAIDCIDHHHSSVLRNLVVAIEVQSSSFWRLNGAIARRDTHAPRPSASSSQRQLAQNLVRS